jgi:hypothetical protein
MVWRDPQAGVCTMEHRPSSDPVMVEGEMMVPPEPERDRRDDPRAAWPAWLELSVFAAALLVVTWLMMFLASTARR